MPISEQNSRLVMISILVPNLLASVVRPVESLPGRMSEAASQVEGLFESLLSESFGEGS
jgi:hypothetical protein